MGKKVNGKQSLCMVALMFDRGKISCSFYGDWIYEYIIRGKELLRNGTKVVVSEGDIFESDLKGDITPFTIYDEMCTIEKNDEPNKVSIYAVTIEDISISTAKKLDNRMKKECKAYLGMTSIDINSTDDRKQFWKKLIRAYSIEWETFTCFGCEEEGFLHDEKITEKYGFKIYFDNFPDEIECENKTELFSTRQSSFIKKINQLAIKNGRNDSDRGIQEMNYSLVKEVEIAGLQIWKAIEDINQVYVTKSSEYIVVDYLFTSWYQAAQGVERLLKIVIELINYGNTSYDKGKVDELLLGHNHVAMYEFIDKEMKLSFNKNEKKMLELLSKFYNEGRYNRFSYSENDLLELKIIHDFGKDITEESFNDKVKHFYAKSLGKISHNLYNCISNLSVKLNIFVNELNCDSVSNYVFNNYYDEDLYMILERINNSKKELLWYLMKNSNNANLFEGGEDIEALPFDECWNENYLGGLLDNIYSESLIYDFVSAQYDEMVEKDKKKWMERLKFIEMIGDGFTI